MCLSICSRFRLKLGDRDRFVPEVWPTLRLESKRVAEPAGVVALRVILARVSAARFLAGQRCGNGRLGAVEQITDLTSLEQVGVEDVATVVDGHVGVPRTQVANLQSQLHQRVLGPED